jgi:PadR family transcriptional regulator, regulatory protein AphA
LDIMYAILGFLSWRPFTGYEIKKMLADAVGFHWSGNNNQIYTALVQLRREGLAQSETEYQERLPARKIYSITPAGKKALNKWVRTPPEPLPLRKPFLVQLAWSASLETAELEELLNRYEHEVDMQRIMLQEKIRRGDIVNPARTPREKFIWEMTARNYIRCYETELEWVRQLRRGLPE